MPLLLWLFFAQTPMPTPLSTTCSSWLPSNQYVPSPHSSTTAVSLYCSVALARIPHSTAMPLQALRNLITQKYENLKSADNISTHVMGRAEVIDLVERVRFEILYLVPRSSFKTVVGGRSPRPSPRPRPGGIRKRQGPKRGPKRENGNGEDQDGSPSRSRSEQGRSGRGVPGGY